jgi:hypothetical protein
MGISLRFGERKTQQSKESETHPPTPHGASGDAK